MYESQWASVFYFVLLSSTGCTFLHLIRIKFIKSNNANILLAVLPPPDPSIAISFCSVSKQKQLFLL